MCAGHLCARLPGRGPVVLDTPVSEELAVGGRPAGSIQLSLRRPATAPCTPQPWRARQGVLTPVVPPGGKDRRGLPSLQAFLKAPVCVGAPRGRPLRAVGAGAVGRLRCRVPGVPPPGHGSHGSSGGGEPAPDLAGETPSSPDSEQPQRRRRGASLSHADGPVHLQLPGACTRVQGPAILREPRQAAPPSCCCCCRRHWGGPSPSVTSVWEASQPGPD